MENSIRMENELQEKKTDVPACCNGCIRWKKFGKNCWYYWEGKKQCTMWTAEWEDAAMQQPFF